MGRIIEQYLKNLDNHMSMPTTFTTRSGRLSLCEINAFFLSTHFDEECPEYIRRINESVNDLCKACIAYEDALVTSMDKCKAEGNEALYDLLAGLESTFADEVIG